MLLGGGSGLGGGSLLEGLRHQGGLGVQGRGILRPGHRGVSAVHAEVPGLHIVGTEQLHIVLDLPPDGGIDDRTGDLHPPLGVAGHQVGGADVDLSLLPHAEGVDAGVLQEPAHNGEHPDAVGEAGHAGPQAADAPYVHGDGHPGLAGLGQLVDEMAVGDRVDFDKDAGGLPLAGLFDLLVDEGHEPGLQAVGRHQQLLVIPLQIGGGHVLEEGGRVGADGRAGRHEAEIGVQLGGLLVVVARADLGNVLDAGLVPPGDEADLGVDLVVLKAVEHGAARLLQPLGPGDVVLLVKACPQLHEHSDILAVFRRRGQVLHQFGGGGQAVDGDLDGQNRGVVGRLPHQVEEGVHGVVGVEEQGVPPEDLGDHLLAAVEAGGPLGGVLGVAQGGGALRGQLALQGVHVPHGQGRLGEEHVLPGQIQPLAQVVQQLLGGMSLDLQPHGSQPGPLLEHLLHVLPEVLHHVVVLVLRADVRVAGDRDDVLLLDLIGVKEGVGVGQDDLLGEQVPQPPLLQLEEGGESPGDGHQAEPPLPVPAEGQNDVQALGGQMGKGVVAVHYHGGEHRLHIVPEPALHLLALLAVQLVRLQVADVAGPQALLQLGDDLVPLLVQGGHRLADGLELFDRREAAAAVHIVLLG